MGPCIVTKDEIPDLAKVHIQSIVNGEIRQDAYGSDMINSVPVLIEWISSIITCDPGDCISTGTPAGCGTFRNPPTYLKPGDVCLALSAGDLTSVTSDLLHDAPAVAHQSQAFQTTRVVGEETVR